MWRFHSARLSSQATDITMMMRVPDDGWRIHTHQIFHDHVTQAVIT
jgi:hypothetical protein